MANEPWREKYVSGSFRGVPFKTESSSVEGGRRKQKREFAQREVGNTEDLGKKLKDFKMELYVIGGDYFTDRDALEEALDKEGPGELIHPYRGAIQVQAGSFTLTETSGETRIARFSVEFSEKGKIKFPDQVADDIANSIAGADNVIDNSKNFFETALDTINQAAFVIQGAADDTAALVDSIEDAITSVTEPIANLTYAIRNLKADINDLIKLPGELADRIQSVLDDLLSEFENDPDTARKVLGVFVGSMDTAFDPIVGETPSRLTQKGNQEAISNLGKELGLANQTKAAVDVDFTSTQEAIKARDEITENLDEQLFLVRDDELFQAIKDTQTSLTKALPSIGTTELVEFTPPQTIPALVISHSLFDTLDKEQEILDQNEIERPGFVPGGETIQVSAEQ
jgi:prophage DNA circulation protein